MCKYVFGNGIKCEEEALMGSEFCALHTPFPEDRNSEEFKRLAELKKEKVKEKIGRGDFNFEGAILENIDFSGMEIKGDVNFTNAVILGDTIFNVAKIGGNALFGEAKIGGNAWFRGAKIGGDAWFRGAKIGGDASFGWAKIGGNASFEKAKIGGYASFEEAKIEGHAWFKEAKIGGDASFNKAKIGGNAWFDGAKIGGNAWFDTLDIKGKLSFEKAIFYKPEAEENASRAARRTYERLGDRETADRYFYREMVARRKQKNKFIQFFEWLFADLTCQYGTNPKRPVLIWLIFVIGIFPLIYYFGNGVVPSTAHGVKSLVSSEYFSIVTATTLGYGDLQPALRTVLHIPQFFRMVASFEAIFGTFMWVIFLTVFARKYMR